MPLLSDSRPEAIKLLKILQNKKPKAQEEVGDDDENGSDQDEEKAKTSGKKKGKGAKPKPEAKPKGKAKAKADPTKCEGIVDPKKSLQGVLPRPCEALYTLQVAPCHCLVRIDKILTYRQFVLGGHTVVPVCRQVPFC